MEGDNREVTYDPLIALMAKFENVRAADTSTDPFADLTIEEKLQKHIVDGIKKNLDRDLEEACETYTPLQIINDILLLGMKTVGVLFGKGEMQLPFVLQSAEVMKAAVRYLEPKMEKADDSNRGSMLIATVQGDVHDIGKNLVDIILTNNGFRVVNIGIKQPINNIIEQAVASGCQVIGMSGLLVKSTVIMKENLLELNSRGLSHFPVILGGAALTRHYVEHDLRAIYEGSVYYAQDAFEGLRLMDEICSGNAPAAPQKEAVAVKTHRQPEERPDLYVFDGIKSQVSTEEPVPNLPFYGARKHTKFDLTELFKYINPVALWRGQWQFKKQAGMTNPEFTAWLEENVGPIQKRIERAMSPYIKPAVKWGYFWCQSEGNELIILQEDAKTERLRFTFPRQPDNKRSCLADFFKSKESGQVDVVGFHIVTAGPEISPYERDLFEKGEYQDYLYTHGFGVETAEALAEYWHMLIRKELGLAPDPKELKLLFSAKYQGSRYSFGYPACPNLEDQAKLFELLQPEDIGLELSEEFMLMPEQSTSAIIVHHREAKYFSV